MKISYKKTLEDADRQRYEKERPVCEGRNQPRLYNKGGQERPCHNCNSPKDLYSVGMSNWRHCRDHIRRIG